MNKNSIHLTPAQRQVAEHLISAGQAPARKIMHAHVLLKADESEQGPGWSDGQIREAFGVGLTTIWRLRRRFLSDGLDDALNRCPQPERPEKRKLTGEAEAHLIALACTAAPSGYERWSIRLLTKQAIEVEIVEQVGRETIRRTLKKMNSSRG